MTYEPQKYHRRSIRLPGYDYGEAGTYFVTICLEDRGTGLFGHVSAGGVMVRNPVGQMVQTTWVDIPGHYAGVGLDVFVVMPDHLHGIITLGGPPPRLSLSDVVQRFKTLTTHRYGEGVHREGWPRYHGRLWQRNYFEHIIRDEERLDLIRRYILDNPRRWAFVDPEALPRTKPAWSPRTRRP